MQQESHVRCEGFQGGNKGPWDTDHQMAGKPCTCNDYKNYKPDGQPESMKATHSTNYLEQWEVL